MSRPLALDADETQAVDDRLALAGVLQELTVAALDLFEPSRSVDDFLQTVAARMGCRVAVCLDVKEGRLSLLGSAGLARASRSAPLPAAHAVAANGDVALPYLEIAAPSLLRWIIRPEGPHAGTWWLLLYFDREPQLARQYKGMLDRLARQVDCAFGHRRLYEMLLARERNLRVASSHLETVVSHLSSGILVIDEHEQIAQANEAFCRLVGLSSSALIGANAGLMLRKIKDVFRNPDDFVARTAKAIEAGAVVADEAPEELADGRFIVRDFVPILVDGAQVGRMWTFLDVTRTHRAAEEIRVLNEGLERRVAERTCELALTQERLALSDRMASVGTLAAGVAHEINNPLAYITANLEMIVEELHDTSTGSIEHVVTMAREAHEGAERVRRIVRGLKTFSRTDKEQRVAIDLHRVLEQSITMAFNEVKHHARLDKAFGPVPVVEGDETRLGQVFINLLVNAAQAIPSGQAQSNTIRVVTRTDDCNRAVVEVHDTGPGISPEILSHVFDPFFTTKAVGVGTGLGLSICHGIVAALGGEITVDSVLGRGTIVRVTLAAAPVTSAPVVPSSPVEPQPHWRASVLIVDDDPLVRSALQRGLKDHDVATAANGLEALERIRDNPGFHLVLCDLMMPDMTGMDLHAQLARELPHIRERMVFMTGGAFTAQARSFLEEVTNDRVEKPFNLATLRALVRRSMPDAAVKAAG